MLNFIVEIGPRTHPVHVGGGCLDRLGDLAREAGITGKRSAIVTDSNVAGLYLDRTAATLKAAGFETLSIEIEAGEASKSLATVETIYDRLVEAGLDRSSAIFALGGGVVGDLAGFVGATFLRGLPVVQVPTTLLAQVDSALGGKTGVNHPRAKNLIGSFYQPRLLVADPAVLSTLPDREFREGLAEAIKYGAILDAAMIADLEKSLPAILARQTAALEQIVARSLRHKASIVERDERDAGMRKILNFGHTVGHALEAASGYGRFLHGEAVAIGMVAAAKLSCVRVNLPGADADRLTRLLSSAGLPTTMPAGWRSEEFLRALKLDKKRAGGGVEFVLLSKLGQALTRRLGFDEISAVLE